MTTTWEDQDRPIHESRPTVFPCNGDPPGSWEDTGFRETYDKPYGRGKEWMVTEDEVQPARQFPSAMMIQDPLHLPYGTGERTDLDFWGPTAWEFEKRPLMPSYAITEHEWDRNPRFCGKMRSEYDQNPYEYEGSVSLAAGADLARSVDVRQRSLDTYWSFAEKTNPDMYGADPVMAAGGSGGMTPVLTAPPRRHGTSAPSPVYSAYKGIPGGALPGAGPARQQVQLPGATRSNRTYEHSGDVTGGFVPNYGDDNVNPVEGGRISGYTTQYEQWGQRSSPFVPAGPDIVINDPLGGIRWGAQELGAYSNQPFVTGGPTSAGPSLQVTPVKGGRPSKKLNFETIISGGASSGVGSSLQQNPVEGGRISLRSNFDRFVAGGASSGVGSSLQQNPVAGGRISLRSNFDRFVAGGALSGVGSSLQQNPVKGGRPSKLINFDCFNVGGAQSGVSGNVNSVNNVLGGFKFARTEGCPGMVPVGGFLNGDYGGEATLGLQVTHHNQRNMEESILLPGASGRGGDPMLADEMTVNYKSKKRESLMFDNTPDPILQLSARSTLGARALLDFSDENLADSRVSKICL